MGLYLGYTGPYKLYIGRKNQSHVHDFVFEQTVEATCTTNGYSLYRCSCNETEMRDISAALDHIRLEPSGSNYSNKGDGTHEYTCTRCSSPVIEDHTFGTYIWMANGHYQQCKYCISQMSEVQAHTPVPDAGGTGWHCEVCNSPVEALVGQLETPNISIENNILIIEPVEGATSYDVWIGSSSELYSPSNTSYPITEGIKCFCSTSMLRVDLDAYYQDIKNARTRQLTSAPFIDFITVRACSNEYEPSEYSNGVPINLKDFFTDSLTVSRTSEYEGQISDTDKLNQLIAHESEGVYVYAELEDRDAEFLLANYGSGVALVELQDSLATIMLYDTGLAVSDHYKFLPKTQLYFRSLDPISCPACGLIGEQGEEIAEAGRTIKSFENCKFCQTRTAHYQHIWNDEAPECEDVFGCRVKWCSTCGTKYCDVCGEELEETKDNCPTCLELIREFIWCPSCDDAKFVWCDHDHDTESHPDQEPGEEEECIHDELGEPTYDYTQHYSASCSQCGIPMGTSSLHDFAGGVGGVCVDCGYECTHLTKTYVKTVPATCGADGIVLYTCNNCGVQLGNTIPATELHDYDETKTTVYPPTCKEQGYTTKWCKVCQSEYNVDYKDPDPQNHTHSEDDTGTVTSPTCTTDGYTTYTCSLCGQTYTDNIITATGQHDWETEYTIDIDPTHTTEGSKSYHCKNCSATTGATTIEKIAEHDWDEGETTTAGTCTTKSVITYTCTCGETKTETGDYVHNYTTTVIQPTCGSAGKIVYKCACGAEYEEDGDKATEQHTLQWVAAKAATCTEAGNTSGHYCLNCDYSTITEIEALDHDYDDSNAICTRCGLLDPQLCPDHPSTEIRNDTEIWCTICGTYLGDT